MASSLSFPTRGGVGSGARRHQLGAAVALGLVLLLAVAFRLALVANAPAFIVNVDSADFFAAAYHLAEDGTFPLPAKRAPLYPLFLAGLTALVGPSLELIALAQHLLGLVTILLAYLLGALAFNRVVGLISAAWLAVNCSLLAMEHTIISEALLTPLLLASLLLLFRGLRGGRLWTVALAGVALGLCALTRPTVQPVLALAALALLLSRRPWRFRLAAVGVLAIGFAVVVSPWILRNRLVHGITAISSGLGSALYVRTHDHDPTFTYRLRGDSGPDRRWNALQNRVIELSRRSRTASGVVDGLQREFGLTYQEADRVLLGVTLQIMRQEPERYARGTLAMLGQLLFGIEKRLPELWRSSRDREAWRSWPATLILSLETNAQRARGDPAVAAALTALQDQRAGLLPGALLLLGALGCLRRGPSAALLPLSVLSQLLLYAALDGALYRYRAQFQPLLAVLAAVGLTLGSRWLVQAVRRIRHRWRPASAAHRTASGP